MFRQVALAALFAAALAAPAAAQQITQIDIQRLQDDAYQASIDVQQLRGRDAVFASRLQSQLDDLRDEVIYLKVKLRKDGTLGRSGYSSVRDRIEDVRSQARERNYAALPPPPPPRTAYAPLPAPLPPPPSRAPAPLPAPPVARGDTEVPAGTEMDVRMTNTLDSGSAQVEDRFEGTTMADLIIGGRMIIPAGSVMRGVVTDVDPATRTNRTAKMSVSFDQVTINGSPYPIRGTVTQAIEGEGIKGETGRIATGAGVGAVLGAVLGGVKGAVLGTVIGGGGTIAATEGKQVQLPQGSVLRVRFDSPAQLPSTPR